MKKLFTFCVALLGLAMLVSCGGSKKPEVVFWHAMGADKQAVIDEIIREFNKIEPDIKVKQVSLGDYVTLRDTISAGISADEIPNIAQTYPDHVALYLYGKAVMPLDDYINDPEYGLSQAELDDFIPGFLAEGRIFDTAGHYYSLPFNKSSEVLVYNKTLFTKYGWEVPKTWEECYEISKKFTQTTEYAALIADEKAAAGLSYDSEANLFITMLQQWGGEYTKFDENGKGVYAFDNQSTRDALGFYLEAYQNKYFATTTYFGTTYSSDAFKAGQMAMTISSSAGVSYNVPADGSFEIGVTTYPQHEGSDKNYVIQQGTNVSLLKCADKDLELQSWKFLKFLTGYEAALIWSRGTSYFPIRKSVLNSEQYQDYISGKIVDENGQVQYKPTVDSIAASVGLQQQDWFYTNVAFLGTSAARDQAELIVQAILYGGKTIDEAIQVSLQQLQNQ